MEALLFPHLAAGGDRPALIVDDVVFTGAALRDAVADHRARLAALGIAAGDRVGVWTQGSPATAIALLGNASAGVISVPLNPKLGVRELDHILADARPRLLLAADPAALGPWSRPEPLLAIDLDTPSTGAPEAALDPSAPLLILYTSGTTGAPKGAVLTVGNVIADLDGLADAWGWGPEDTVVHALPLFHVHGLVLGLFGALRAGGCLRWLPRFDPAALAAALGGGGRTMLFAVPTMYHRLADLAEESDGIVRGLRAARLLISGSAALSAREHRRLAELCGRGVYERYGLTETLINCAVRADGPPLPGLVGPPLRGIELRLVDDARRPIDPADEAAIGEVAVRGPNVFAGYLNRPEATAAVVDGEGWFYTGDLATRRASDGAIRIVGRRATDLIKSGGFKVGAGEVEAALLEHPEIREAAVLGIADEDLGERIVAFVVARDLARPPAADALVGWVAELLTPHKRPREVHLIDALPRNPMGKVQKGILRERHLLRGAAS
ncbi:MAG: AMP-binding protein [Myxococcales bacterium]|nr:AMP-binding protein [Myxococcales bacterium]